MKQTIENILHDNFKKKVKREKKFVLTVQLIIFIIFIVGWELGSRLHLLDPLIFSSPAKVTQLMFEKLIDGTMTHHLAVTLVETIIGFLLGTLLGVVLATILWSSRRLSNIADPYLVVLNAMPKVALGPIFIVALGPGYISIIMMGAIISIIITTIVVFTAFSEVDAHYITVLKTFGATRKQIFTEAIFPSSFPTIISTLKVNVGLSWVGIIVGEFLVANQGLGYLIIYGFQVFDFTLVMASLVLIAIFAALMYKVVEFIEKKYLERARS